MKAKPLAYDTDAGDLVQVEPAKATLLKIHLPGPSGIMILPVMIKGTRAGTNKWTWNGDMEKPTLKPSVLNSSGHFAPNFKPEDSCWCKYAKEHLNEKELFICYRCHTWITDGKAQFLPDCSHELKGQTLDLLEVE